jgi:hypothetical protein
MFSKRPSRMPLRFHVNGGDQQAHTIALPSAVTASAPSSSLPIKRFAMFQNLQNAKPCGSCGGR